MRATRWWAFASVGLALQCADACVTYRGDATPDVDAAAHDGTAPDVGASDAIDPLLHDASFDINFDVNWPDSDAEAVTPYGFFAGFVYPTLSMSCGQCHSGNPDASVDYFLATSAPTAYAE